MSSTTTKDLVQLARNRSLTQLEEVWLAGAERIGESELAPFLAALDVLSAQRENDLAQSLLDLLVPGLETAGRWTDVLEVLRRQIALGANDETTRKRLVTALEHVYGDRPGFEAYLRSSGLDRQGARLAHALERLDAFLSFPVGQHVFHASGWGVGRVVDVVRHSGDLVIDFEEKTGHRFPIEGAAQFLERLAEDDIRAQIFSNLEGLKELAESDPAELLRRCVRSHGGQAAVSRIKQDLIGPVLTSKQWSRIWQRAKRALTHDPHVHISPGSRPVITLRERAQTFAEQVVEELEAARGLSEAVKIVRRFVREVQARPDAVDAEGLRQVAATFRKGLHALAPTLEGREAGAGYEATLVLEQLEQLGAPAAGDPNPRLNWPETAAEFVEMALGIRDPRARERFVAEVAQRFGERFEDLAVDALVQAPKELFVPLAAWMREHAPERLVEALTRLVHAADPEPYAFLALARESFAGRFDDLEGAPSWLRVFERLLALFDKYERRRSGADTAASVPNLRPQVRALLEGGRYELVRRYFQEAPAEAVQHMFARIMGSHALDDEVREAARTVVARNYPELLVAAGGRFWEEDRVYATQRGIEKQAERLRELKHDKMNAVAKAIGDAAAFGDLSENAEFTAALEERDRLVARIERMQKELQGAVALEDMHLPAGVVTPGKRVELLGEGGGAETYTILGPWDVDEKKGVISYTAPLAQGLLGRRVGERVVISLPDGSRREVEIKAVERAI